MDSAGMDSAGMDSAYVDSAGIDSTGMYSAGMTQTSTKSKSWITKLFAEESCASSKCVDSVGGAGGRIYTWQTSAHQYIQGRQNILLRKSILTYIYLKFPILCVFFLSFINPNLVQYGRD